MGLLKPITANISGYRGQTGESIIMLPIFNLLMMIRCSFTIQKCILLLLLIYLNVPTMPFISPLGVYSQYTKQTKNGSISGFARVIGIVSSPETFNADVEKRDKVSLSPLVKILVTIKAAQWLVLASHRGTKQCCHQDHTQFEKRLPIPSLEIAFLFKWLQSEALNGTTSISSRNALPSLHLYEPMLPYALNTVFCNNEDATLNTPFQKSYWVYKYKSQISR